MKIKMDKGMESSIHHECKRKILSLRLLIRWHERRGMVWIHTAFFRDKFQEIWTRLNDRSPSLVKYSEDFNWLLYFSFGELWSWPALEYQEDMFWAFNIEKNHSNKMVTLGSVLKVLKYCYNALIFKDKIAKIKLANG